MRLESLLASIRTERQQAEDLLQNEQKGLDFLLHPVRELQQRH